jgi:Zn-dependent protease with chaperone function
MGPLLIAILWIAGGSVAFDPETRDRAAELARQKQQVLALLGELDPAKARAYLRQRRMPPCPPQESREILATLPPQVRQRRITSQEILSRIERMLQPVLAYHGREGKLEIVLIHDTTPFASLFGRVAILISTRLLAITNESELCGIVAHELGHEYRWWEAVEARRKRDYSQLREIELFCDAVAALTLREMGAEPLAYAAGLKHLVVWGEYFGKTSSAGGQSHPRLQDRLDFIRELAQRLISFPAMGVPDAAAHREP